MLVVWGHQCKFALAFLRHPGVRIDVLARRPFNTWRFLLRRQETINRFDLTSILLNGTKYLLMPLYMSMFMTFHVSVYFSLSLERVNEPPAALATRELQCVIAAGFQRANPAGQRASGSALPLRSSWSWREEKVARILSNIPFRLGI